MSMFDIPAPLATLLAALLGGLLLLHVHRKNARRTAALKFRTSVLSALAGLYPIPSNWPRDIDAHLRQVFPSLQQAVAEFRPFVSLLSQGSYDRAWLVYRLGQDGREIDKQLYHQYMGFTSADEPTVDPKEAFRINVARLLNFADET